MAYVAWRNAENTQGEVRQEGRVGLVDLHVKMADFTAELNMFTACSGL